jgi:ATP-dependent Lon protease
MQGALKAYMESGEATFGGNKIIGTAGIILLGNIPRDDMDAAKDMFRTLPDVFRESALLDRFHGFIEGKNIPRMNETLKINNWALNTEYFTEIMHLMRSSAECMRYRAVVEALVDYPPSVDTRDKEAVLRICTAYLKLFFPHWTKPEYVEKGEFNRYCLRPAVNMRGIIRKQLQLLDAKEFGGKNLAAFSMREG